MAQTADAAVHVTVRMAADIVSELDRVAGALERPRDWVIQRALRQYLAAEGAEVMATSEGLAELRRGESVDFDEAIADMRDIVGKAGTDIKR